MIHLYVQQYQEAARALLAQGYALVENPGSVLSPLYVKGDDTLYLYRPILDQSYVYVETDDAGWSINIETSTVYHPRGVNPFDAGGPWVAREYASRPAVFGVRDAAEHLGLSESAIRAAIYRNERNPLVPTQQVSGRIVFSDADLHEWARSRERGTPRSARYRERRLLETMNRKRLAQMAAAAVKRGDLDKATLLPLLAAAGYEVEDTDDLGDIVGALSKVARPALVDALAR